MSTGCKSCSCPCHTHSGPKIGKPAPYFSGLAYTPDDKFKDVSLDDYKGKYLILFFYPMDFTFVCPTEIRAFSEKAAEFKALNCEVLSCSTDTVYSHKAWTQLSKAQHGLGPVHIPLMSDPSRTISDDYGVLREGEGVADRGLFIIDNLGILRQVIINDAGVGRSVDEVERLIHAYQYVDKNGEMCPVNWKPGKPAIKADQRKAKTRGGKGKKSDDTGSGDME